MRLTKFNEETGKYEYIAKPMEYVEYRALTLAALQKLGEFEDRAEGEWKDVQRPYKTSSGSKGTSPYRVCSACKWEYPVVTVGQHLKKYNYCPNCGARMKGADDEQKNCTN